MPCIRLLLFASILVSCQRLSAQDSASFVNNSNVQQKFFTTVDKKISSVDENLTKRTRKILTKMQKQELKLKNKLSKVDSIASENLFTAGLNKYDEFQKKLNQKTQGLEHIGLNNYIPYLDTLKNTLKFLEGNGSKISDQYKQLSEKVSALEGRFADIKNIQQYLKERRQYLKQQLSKYGMDKYLKKMSKEVYYAGQLIKDYKEILNDPKKIEMKTIALLREIPEFKKFIQRNSMLASIFGVPSDNSSYTASLVGLQTRASVQQYLATSMPLSGTNPQQFLTQQLQSANNQLAGSKNIPKVFDFSDNLGEAPDFKPNQQKTKSFFKRLEYSANVQFGKTNSIMPSTGEFALGLGYKLNDNGLIGIGSSYKLGLGTRFNNIRFTHQGFGMRSYLDWKIRSGFYFSGGYEKNYFPQLQNVNLTTRTGEMQAESWQQSGLVGIKKKYPINKKVKGSAQILFDFLSYKNIPKSQPILMRFGWSF